MTAWPTNTGRRHYDVLIVGGSPAGLACAVSAARAALSVLVVERSRHLGGMLTGGIGVMDVQYDGPRAAFYDEYCHRVMAYYAQRYGKNSQQYRDILPCAAWPLRAEPHVAEAVLADMLAEYPRIEALREHVPVSVTRSERILRGVRFARWDGVHVGSETHEITAGCYVDATYEGDVFALAGEPYRVGREDRRECGEPHAGRIFTRREITPDGTGKWPRAASAGEISMRTFKAISQEIFAGSTGEGDDAVQAYSYRLCLSRIPENRLMPTPPEDYDPAIYRRLAPHVGIGSPNLPNDKRFWFRNLVGPNWRYPRASEPERQEIRDIYRRHATGFLYFLQNDDSVPEPIRAEARGWGFARDEFVENENFPYELYVREARRLVGRHVFTEHDASLARSLRRTPIHHDSVAFADWFMDSHEVSDETQRGSSGEGKILLTELTRPSQVPFRCMLPPGLDNLIVPLCVSATHVGWGTLRLEPVWMHLGEVAGRAAALAAVDGTPVADIDVGALQRDLVRSGSAIAFFSDVDLGARSPDVMAANLLAVRGFFADYNARLGEPLTVPMARVWASATASVVSGTNDPMTTAVQVAVADRLHPEPGVNGKAFAGMLADSLRTSPEQYECSPGASARELSRSAAMRQVLTAIQSGTQS